MRIHTSATYGEVAAAVRSAGTLAHITPKGSRKRERAFDVTLYVLGKDDLHRRFGNSGRYGRGDDVAATWDEWGKFMVALYEVDPTWTCNEYPTEADFYEETRSHREYVRSFRKPTSLEWRTHLAPWLD